MIRNILINSNNNMQMITKIVQRVKIQKKSKIKKKLNKFKIKVNCLNKKCLCQQKNHHLVLIATKNYLKAELIIITMTLSWKKMKNKLTIILLLIFLTMFFFFFLIKNYITKL